MASRFGATVCGNSGVASAAVAFRPGDTIKPYFHHIALWRHAQALTLGLNAWF
jgi:hypothetical protein